MRNAAYRPGRSVLCIALIASATFVIVSLDAFRGGGSAEGTGGFPLWADSVLPLIHDPNTAAGRAALNLPELPGVEFVPFRVRPGDDTSCLNLYQPLHPRILAPPPAFLPTDTWRLLDSKPAGGAIPVIADANSLTYVLHRSVGEEFELDGVALCGGPPGPRGTPSSRLHLPESSTQSHQEADQGVGCGPGGPPHNCRDRGGAEPLTFERPRFRIVAALQDSLFQGELIVSEANFLRLFPDTAGYRFFLLKALPGKEEETARLLDQALSDYGFHVQSAPARLASFHRVENAYLDTFRALGALGLLLGTVGLAAVLMRNVLERRRELALLRAVGYCPHHLARIVLAENLFLLLAGLSAGAVCAAVAVAPAVGARGGGVPILSLSVLLTLVLLAGMLASLAGTAAVFHSGVLDALRSE
jgi:hypothetical protein